MADVNEQQTADTEQDNTVTWGDESATETQQMSGVAGEEEVEETEVTTEDQAEETEEAKEPANPPEKPAEQPTTPAPAQAPPPATPPAERAPSSATDPFEALKIGKEDTLVRKMIEAHQAGDLKGFMKAYATDWDAVDDLDLVKGSLEKKYAALDKDDKAFMIRRDMAKYATDDSFDDDDKRMAAIALKMDARAIRDGYKADQAKYTIPDKPSQSPEELAQQQQAQQAAADFEKAVLSDPFLATFETSKAITLGEGKDAFNYAVPDLNVRDLLTTDLTAPFVIREEGKPPRFDLKGYTKAVAFTKNEADLLTKLEAHYVAKGKKQADAKLRNLNNGAPAAAQPETGPAVKWG